MRANRKRNQLNRVHPGCLAALAVGAGFSMFFLPACGDENPAGPATDPPSIQSVDQTTLAPGDTVNITGEKFATPASQNRVTFNNSLAVVIPYHATGTSMSAVVPANAATGPMTVRSNGLESNSITVEILREVGDVWVMSARPPFTFKLPNPNGIARYLVAPHSATSSMGAYSYAVTPGQTSVYPLKRKGLNNLRPGREEYAYIFESQLREEAIEYLKLHGAGKRFHPNQVRGRAAPDTTTFLVLNSADPYVTNNPAYYTTVTAALRYEGTHTLVYSDITNYSGANGFNQSDYDQLGVRFDGSIHPTDVGAFGPETDIDGNGKVVALFTRIVNSLTPEPSGGFISGFFLLNDLGPGVFPAGTTNGMEIFYTLVPDTTGEWKQKTKSEVKTIASETLAHEFQHMISFGYRFITLGGAVDYRYLQETWLEEGMAHIAEDLNAMPDGNVSRANLYLAKPGDTSLLLNTGRSLSQRGGIYLFLRYLGDRYGDKIYKDILQNTCVGTSCIQQVTGKDFFSNVADFFAALSLSNSAVPHDGKYDFVSINYPADFNPLPVSIRVVSEGQFSGTVMNAAADFYEIENINDFALTLAISGRSSSTMRYLITRLR